MADKFRRAMLRAYLERLERTDNVYPLQAMFSNRVESDAETVEVDIERSGSKVAVDVVRRSDQVILTTLGEYSSKEYAPPLYALEGSVTASQLRDRMPGENPYSRDVATAGRMISAITDVQVENSERILRAIELQAAQALQTGTVTLKNTESLDFKRKPTHAITPAVKWNAVTPGNPIEDLQAGAKVAFRDGRRKPNTLIFGERAWSAFINNPHVLAYFENRRIDYGAIRPTDALDGLTMQGRFTIGDYDFVAYTYPGFYENEAGVDVPYVTEGSVIMLDRTARLTLAFAAVEILPQYQQMYNDIGLPAVPQFARGEIVPYAYHKPPRALMAGVQSAPLVIPTAIDVIVVFTEVDA